MKKIIAFDFSGTLLKRTIAEQASKRRFKHLGKTVNKAYLRKACATDEHYKLLKKILSKKTGIKNNKKLTTMMTDLFKKYMLQIAREKKDKIFQPGIINAIKKLKARNYKTAIISGIRTDIIKSMLKITKKEKLFDYIFAQNPSLDYTNRQLVKKCRKKGKIAFMIGDKSSDLIAGKTIFVTWGHPTGSERKKANFTARKPIDLLKIIK